MRTRALIAGLLVAVAAGCSTSQRPAHPVPSASAAATPSTPAAASAPPTARTVALAHLPANLRGRVPPFAPAPAATRVTSPANGTAAWYSRIPTEQKVAFITIDDGWVK